MNNIVNTSEFTTQFRIKFNLQVFFETSKWIQNNNGDTSIQLQAFEQIITTILCNSIRRNVATSSCFHTISCLETYRSTWHFEWILMNLRILRVLVMIMHPLATLIIQSDNFSPFLSQTAACDENVYDVASRNISVPPPLGVLSK